MEGGWGRRGGGGGSAGMQMVLACVTWHLCQKTRTAHFQQGRSATYTTSTGEEGHARYLASMPPFFHQQVSGAAVRDKSGSRLTHAETIFFSLLTQCLHCLAQREESRY